MKITDLLQDKNFDYYIHKSPDYGDMKVDDKINSFYKNGIINIKNKELSRSALKIVDNIEKTKHSFSYFIDEKASLEEQFRQVFEARVANGLFLRDYAIIIRVPKENRDSIIKQDGETYKIDGENIICILHRKERVHDGTYEYSMHYPKVKKDLNLEDNVNKSKANDLSVPVPGFRRPESSDLNVEGPGFRKLESSDLNVEAPGFRKPESSDLNVEGPGFRKPETSDLSVEGPGFRKPETSDLNVEVPGFRRPSGNELLGQGISNDLNEKIDDYLLTVVSGVKMGYQSDFSYYNGGRIMVTVDKLKDMVDRGCNIIRAKRIGNFIDVEFEEYQINKNRGK